MTRGWALLTLLLLVAGLVGCASAAPQPITFPVSCAGSSPGPSATAGDTPTRMVPARVLHTAPATLVLVPVCLSRQGPFPFVLDTGATQSVIDRSLAQRLRLPLTGKTKQATGVGCTSPAGQLQMANWSVGEVGLNAQPLSVLPLAGGTAGPGISGLLGSDVWSRFGQFTLDYRAGQLMLPGLQQATIPSAAQSQAPVAGRSRRAPMTVVHSGAATAALVPVNLNGHGPMNFVLDTGASSSVVDRGVAQRLALPTVGNAQHVTGVSCTATSRPVHIASWSVGTIPLPTQDLDDIALPTPGLTGLLGSDVLYRFGSITVDYAGGQLILGG